MQKDNARKYLIDQLIIKNKTDSKPQHGGKIQAIIYCQNIE